MRMYLSSYKFGNHIEELKKLVGEEEKVAIITNALDFGDQARVTETVKKVEAEFSKIGLEAERLDLRAYFGKSEELEQALKEYGMVWVLGGNAFLLRRAYKQSGFDKILKKRLVEDTIVYAGFSAALVVITPTLDGAEIVDDPSVLADGYDSTVELSGLGLLPYVVAVHYKSEHPESDKIEEYIKHCQANDIPYKTLRDGEVIIINGEEEKILK